MPTVDALLAEIDKFLSETGWADSTFSRRAVNDGKFVGRLRHGADVTLTTVDRVRAYITKEREALNAKGQH
jgi:hypothetical protein